MKYVSKFLNHACHFYENDEEIIIVDPWFSGEIFDKSWALLKEVEVEEEINIQKIRHIFISHEHPDHLHWATLKFIRDASKGQISVYITSRHNKNIFNNLKNLGFDVHEIIPMAREKLYDNFYYVQFPFGRDSALVFEVDGKTHLNQNDCYLDAHTCFLINTLIPKVDYWWMQFSLAGYYANHNNLEGLQEAKQYHLDMFTKYYNIFKPATTIPFASYVYFCKKYNSYLNEWIVGLQEHIDKNPDINFQIPFCGDVIGECDNNKSISRWEKLIRQKTKKESFNRQEDKEVVPEQLIIRLADKWLKNVASNLPFEQIAVGFFEEEKRFVFDFKNKKSFFTTGDTHKNIVAKLTKEGLLCFVKFPWGADTLNITACFEVINAVPWRFLLEYKDSDYDR